MPREYKLFLLDMVDAAAWLLAATREISYEDFVANRTLRQAVERNCEILGEAAKGVPAEYQARMPEVDWRGLAGLRDILVHRYHRLDYVVVWDTIKSHLPLALAAMQRYLTELDQPGS